MINYNNLAAASVASSVFFVTLVTTQWGHLISVRRKTPYFSDAVLNKSNSDLPLSKRLLNELMNSRPPLRVVIAIVLSALTANFFNEIPAVQVACSTGSVSYRYWGVAIGLSFGIFVIGEMRKWIILLFPEYFVSKNLLFKW
jgi:hypothetical protein